ncbi:D-glucuronyl C5-epimerase family protein [Aureimonas leprariae]|uniref:D-glucuronyl C5-epimerase C-terminal domain-containing protein n=1 Tax=Plantimonas leprariae TaxID=2615207 RepID=A0A7V7PK58_9HYPH|nr:D-glucuronyl C5-epimerase family protein [Aureimonas leprariae]KAB0675924.1 hypothetical protein F6X38_22605 [Aureimonas leprariae]
MLRPPLWILLLTLPVAIASAEEPFRVEIAQGTTEACLVARGLSSNSELSTIGLQERTNSSWPARNFAGMPVVYEGKWSPYVWALDATVLAGTSDAPLQRRKELAGELLSSLREHTQKIGLERFVFYDFNYNYVGHDLKAPWYSALANGFAAIGLMHISKVLADPSLLDIARSYLLPLPTALSYRAADGTDWFLEYVSDDLPNGGSAVVNGHYGALIALHEWSRRTNDCRFAEAVIGGLHTLRAWYPRIVRDQFFAYAMDHLDIKDYGQERAVRQAEGACRLWPDASLCATAVHMRELDGSWKAAGIVK